MRQVKCVSPHGGAHHGTNGRGDPVLNPSYSGPRQLPPNEGGYVDNGVLGRVPVGSVVSAPEPPVFVADGFHFERVPEGGADECKAAGADCWCGVHKAYTPEMLADTGSAGVPPDGSTDAAAAAQAAIGKARASAAAAGEGK